MKITFKNVIPNPMKADTFESSSLWSNVVEINSSEYHFLSSASGRGKSSMLAYINGNRTDYSGELLIDGQNQKEISLGDWAELRKNKLAYLPQDLRLFPELTTWENLEIKNRLTNHKTKEQIVDMLSILGLSDRLKQKAGTLSLGQQQRVALVRALLQPFEILLLDEPFSNIDKENIQKAINLIRTECELNNAGFIITTLGYDYGMENKIIQL